MSHEIEVSKTKRVFAIAAHPDDIEFLMAGTLLRFGQAGYELHYMNVANGCCGTTVHSREEIANIREGEGIEAATFLGATFHKSICNDLEIFYDKPTLAKLAAIIREVQPSVILTHSPVDYMEDHMNTSRLVVTAAFARGMPNFETYPPAEICSNSVAIYHAQPYSNKDPLGETIIPHIVVDTEDLIEKKIEALALHQSQKRWLDESQGLDSYLQTLKSLDRQVGEMSDSFKYAEGWRQHLHLGFGESDFDPLQADLSQSIQVISP